MAFAGIKTRKKRAVASRIKFVDVKHMGMEPTWKNGQLATDAELRAAYRWYNYFYDAEDAKKFALAFLKANKTGAAVLRKIESNVPKFRFLPLGWQCKVLMAGAKLPKDSMDYLKAKFKELIQEANEGHKDTLGVVASEDGTIPVVVETTKKPTVQDRIANQVSNLIAEFDDQLDSFVKNGYKGDFKPYEYLVSHNVKAPQAQKVAAYYARLVEELSQAIKPTKKTDPQITEAYGAFKKRSLQKLLEFVNLIITDCNQIKVNTKATRKPRARKVKSATQLTSKVKFKTTDDRYKIKSVHPSEIVGASSAWVFNTKTRKLGVFYAEDVGGLKVKGSTVYSFDEKLSMVKNLRKPEQILPQVTQGGKVALRKIMDSIKAKPAKIKGRINGDVVILRVTKG